MENLNYKDIYNYNVDTPVGAVTMYGTHECTRTVKDIEKFTNIEFGDLRAVLIDNVVYLCYTDICRCMGLKNHGERVTGFLDDDYAIINEGRDYYDQIELPYQYVSIPVDHGKFGGIRNESTLFISEPSFYKVAFKSNTPSARRFTDWVIRDILMPLRVQYGGSRPFIEMSVRYIGEKIDYMHQSIQTTMENQSKEFKNIYEEQSEIQSANGGLWRDNMNLSNQVNCQQQFIDQRLDNMDRRIDALGEAINVIGRRVDSGMRVYDQMM